MGFYRRESSIKLLKRATCQTKATTPFNQNSDDDDDHHLCRGSSCKPIRLTSDSRKHGKKAAAIFPQPDDADDQLDIERWSTDKDCTWLSSDNNSPYSFEDDKSFYVSLHKRFSALLMISRSSTILSDDGKLCFDDGSNANPVEEASLLLEKSSNDMALQVDLKEEEVFTWLVKSSRDKTEWGDFQSDFPSPSFNIKRISKIGSSDWSDPPLSEYKKCGLGLGCSEHVTEITDLDDIDSGGPLFWPSDCRLSWSNASSPRNLFCISPRRDVKEIGSPEMSWTPRSVILRLQDRRKDPTGSFKRVPSRFSMAGQDPTETVVDDNVNEPTNIDIPIDTNIADYNEFVLDRDFGSDEELPIELLVGLSEFDGHQGMDAEFGEESFSLDESLTDENFNNLLF